MRTRHLIVLAALAAFAFPAASSASTLIDRNASAVKLSVNDKGQALVSYTARGKKWNVLAWGATGALAPTPGGKQVNFKLDYSGGWGTYKRDVWKTFKNSCVPASSPALAWEVTACTAPDGSHWALQAWQRLLPNYGLAANPTQAVWELRLSHWKGDLPVLTIQPNWAYVKYDHLFGTFSYQGIPVHGFRSTPGGNPLDTFGRNVYLDTFNSAYGSGWKRENSFLTHNSSGTFCYGFYPHGARPSGSGELYRATIIGPGVTPDVMWEGKPLGAYDKELDATLREEQRTLYAHDALCKPV